MKMYMLATPSGLKPCTDEDQQAKQKLKNGEVYQVEVKKQRNYRFLQKYFALLGLVWENMPHEVQELYTKGTNITTAKERFRRDLTIASGYYDEYVNIDGEIIQEPHSISFANMDADTFDKLYSDTIDAILKYYLKGSQREEITNEVISFT